MFALIPMPEGMLVLGLVTTWGMAIIGLVVLLLFGNRLPSVMRSLGEGITEFKKGMNGEGASDPNHRIEDRRD
jgi:sec-independent protein translocase protein TatA